MAEKATIARPYARAAFEFARAQDRLAAWSQGLAAASAAVSNADVAKMLGHPLVTATQVADLVADAAKLEQGPRNFIATLAHNRRLGLLPVIAAMYEALRAEVENVADVDVVSAVPLDAAQEQRLAGALKTRLKRTVRLHCKVDAALMGGAIVRCGDLVIDGSVRERLARMAAGVTA